VTGDRCYAGCLSLTESVSSYADRSEREPVMDEHRESDTELLFGNRRTCGRDSDTLDEVERNS